MDAKTIKNNIKRGLDCLIQSMDILKVNGYLRSVATKLLNTKNFVFVWWDFKPLLYTYFCI